MEGFDTALHLSRTGVEIPRFAAATGECQSKGESGREHECATHVLGRQKQDYAEADVIYVEYFCLRTAGELIVPLSGIRTCS